MTSCRKHCPHTGLCFVQTRAGTFKSMVFAKRAGRGSVGNRRSWRKVRQNWRLLSEQRAQKLEDSSNKRFFLVFCLTSHPGLPHWGHWLQFLSAALLQIWAIRADLNILDSCCIFPLLSKPVSPAHQNSSYTLISWQQGKGRCLPMSCFPYLPSVTPQFILPFRFFPTAIFNLYLCAYNKSFLIGKRFWS